VLCAGCGKPLTNGSKRGRPTSYHDTTWRQRAHRARQATRHDSALSTLASLEAATSALRHALITNKDTAEAYGRTIAAAAKLTEQLEPATLTTASAPPTTNAVTESVTISRATFDTESASTTPDASISDVGRAVPDQPESGTHNGSPARVTKTIDMGDSIGPGWTLGQYEGDADASIWRIHHKGQVVGTVCRSYELATNTRGSESRTSRFLQVPTTTRFAASRRSDRLWRTRDSAPVTAPPQLSQCALRPPITNDRRRLSRVRVQTLP
jgi:hypothetical protein